MADSLPSSLAVTVALPSPDATAALAIALARIVRLGDVIALDGELGVGKTTFARAIIHALGGAGEEVPSPTFTLLQAYELPTITVCHFDLYRLDGPEGLAELGLEDAFADAVSLIEWPDRLGSLLPDDHLHITLFFDGNTDQMRHAQLVGHGRWAARVDAIAVGGDKDD